MKNTFFTFCFFFIFMMCHQALMSQNDTIFYDDNWDTTSKSEAAFYRPLNFAQKGDLYLIKDYYINGSLQFEAWQQQLDSKTVYEGSVIWYFPNGNKNHEINYKNNIKHGIDSYYFENGTIKSQRQYVEGEVYSSKSYHQNGELKTSLIYKEGSPFEGISDCFFEYKNGQEIGRTLFYENTNIPAMISKCSDEGCYYSHTETHYTRNGDVFQINNFIKDKLTQGKKIEYFESNDCAYIKSIKSIKTYNYGRLNGDYIRYDVNGNVLYQGIYKDDYPLSGTFEERRFSLDFISEYKNAKKNGKEIVLNKDTKIAEGIFVNGKRKNGTFVEEREFTDWMKMPIILTLVNGIEEGKQTFYNTARNRTMGYYHASNGEKDGEYAVFDYEGNLLAEATFKEGKAYNGTVIRNGKWLFYNNGERWRENLHIDSLEQKKMKDFSKGSISLEVAYNLSAFEMASSIAFLNTYQFIYSLSVGSLDLTTYGAYHYKKGKIKLSVPEEQKQAYSLYGQQDSLLKDSIIIICYNNNASNTPLVQLNEKWYALGDLNMQEDKGWQDVDSLKISIKELNSLKIAVQSEHSKQSEILLETTLNALDLNSFNTFIVAYNIPNKEISQIENITFTIKKGNLIDGDKKRSPITFSAEEKENILDYIAENKSFPYFIRNNTFQKIKLKTTPTNLKLSKNAICN